MFEARRGGLCRAFWGCICWGCGGRSWPNMAALGVLIKRDYHFLSTPALRGRFCLILMEWKSGTSYFDGAWGTAFVSC